MSLLLVVVGCDSCSSPSAKREVYLGTQTSHSEKLGDIFEDVTVKNTKNGKRETTLTRVLKLRGGEDVSTLETVFNDDKKLKMGRYRRVLSGSLRRSLRFSVRTFATHKQLVIVDLLHPNPKLKSAQASFDVPLSSTLLPLSLLSNVIFLETPKGDVFFFEVSTGHAFRGRAASKPSNDDDKLIVTDAAGNQFAALTAFERWGPGIYYERATSLPALSSTSSKVEAKVDWPKESPDAALFLPGLQASDLDCTAGQALKETNRGVLVGSEGNDIRANAPGDSPFSHRQTPSIAETIDQEPSLFLQSDAPVLKEFVAKHTHGKPSVLSDALALSEAIHKNLKLSDDGGPPSALDTLQYWRGDCDNASALLIAALRARGHYVHGVVGYRRTHDFYGPHAWVEVLSDDHHWLPVDALVPGIGPFSTHIPLFRGLGTSMNMGQVLFQASAEEAMGLSRRICGNASVSSKIPSETPENAKMGETLP
ncbi:MAG: transglutaminase domain-containing protein [Deltaproteobacteria bacterium]|nr:transglutaminase domain-containing protein [Deltaproteobacteria bacterium]